MKKIKNIDDTIILELAAEKSKGSCFIFKLFVTGTSPQSVKAIENIKKICDEYLEGRYILDVIDLYQHPNLASDEQIIASPTLVKQLPLPIRRLIGDMSNLERVLVGLDLK